MVSDPHRTPALLRTVARAVRPGDRVLDIGTGLGVLAIAAAKAGAAQVIALDVDRAALVHARAAARHAGVANRIEFLTSLSFDYCTNERFDVILCETVGSFAFDENILATLADAKKRLLKRGGRIVPQRLELWGALIERIPQLERPADIGRVGKAALLSRPAMLAAVDFGGRIPHDLHLKAAFRPVRDGTARALALWPRAVWWGKKVSDASPLKPLTHWRQGVLPLEPRAASPRSPLGVEIILQPHPDDPLRMTERLWRWAKGPRPS